MISFVVLMLIFLILICICKKITKSFFSIPSIFVIYWSAYFFVTYIFTFMEYDWTFLSMWFILGLSIFLLIGYFIGNNLCVKKSDVRIRLKFIKEWMIVGGIGIGILLAMVYPLIILRKYDASIFDLFNFKKLLEINNNAALDRYEKGNEIGGIFQAFLVFVYAMPLVGGFYLLKLKRLGKLVCLGTIIPAVLVVLLINTKAVFIGAFLLFACGLIIHLVQKNIMVKIKLKYVAIIGGIGVLFIGLLVVSMMLRAGGINLDTFSYVVNRFKSYAFGSLPAFDSWLSHYRFEGYGLGRTTFLGFANLLGLAVKEQGVYQDYFYSGILKTNVYTSLRGIVLDYGIILSFCLSFIVGVINGIAKKKCEKGNSPLSLVFLAINYFFIFYSFIISSFTYNSYSLAFVVFFPYVYISYSLGGDSNDQGSIEEPVQ